METRNQSHPTPRQLAALALGKLTPEGKARLEKHVESCEVCATFLSATPRDTLVNLLRQAAAGMSAAEQSTPSVRDSSTFSGLAASQKSDASPAAGSSRASEQLRPAEPAKPAEQAAPSALDDVPQALREQTKYRIVRLLGRGGMGSVYEAFHERMDRRVAIKVINPSLVDHPEALKRFDQEVRAAAKVEHENVARAYDAEEIGKLRILVMEFVPGQSLDRYLAKNGPLAAPLACRLIQQALVGLNKAHKLGMVHRDLKPQNLMLTPEGTIKILDFGLAKLVSERQQGDGLTRENALMGTPHYLAPEQALDAAKADIRADIYSLGCTLYCLLSGATPFVADTEMKVLLAHQHDVARPLCEVRLDVPRELSDLVGRMLSKNPAERPQTPAEAAQALLPFIKQGTPATRPAPAAVQSPTYAMVEPAKATVAPSETSSAQRAQKVEGVLAAAAATSARPRVKSFRQWPPAWRWTGIVGLGLLASFFALWGVVVLLRTPTGTIVVENVPADAQVQIDGEAVTLSHGGDRDSDKVKIEAVSKGEHRIKLVRNDRTFWSNDVTIEFGGQAVRTRFMPVDNIEPQRPQAIAVANDAQPSGSRGGAIDPSAVQLPRSPGDEKPRASAANVPEAVQKFPNARIGRGTWTRENDVIVQTSLAEEITLLSFGDPAWSRYNVSFRARTDAGPFNFCACWHLQDGPPAVANGRVLRFGNDAKPRMELVSFVDGKAIEDQAFARPGKIEKNRWYDVRIEVRGADCLCFLDDVKILDARDTRYTSGRIGVGAFGTAYCFKDVKVTSEDGKTVLWEGLPRLPGDEPLRIAEDKPAKRIDLLALVDLAKDKVAGHWSADGKALEAEHLASEDFSRLEFPYVPPEEYDYRVSFVCRPQPYNSSALFLICAARQHQFSATYRDPRSGIGLINGERVNENGTSTTKLADKITPGDQHTAVVKVRKDRVEMFFDDELIVEHPTDFQNLSLRYDKKLPREDTLGLAMADRPLRVEAIEVVEISGPGTLLREAEPIAEPEASVQRPAKPTTPAMQKYPLGSIDGGDWKIEGADLVQTATTRGRKLLVFGAPSWSEYDLELETLSHGPSINSKVCFHWSDDEHAYRMFGLEEKKKKSQSFFRGFKGSHWLRGHSLQIPFVRDQWYKVRIEVRGQSCACFVNGVQWYKDRKPDNHFNHGRIAVGNKAGTARFRNISVTALDGTLLWRGLPQPDLANANTMGTEEPDEPVGDDPGSEPATDDMSSSDAN